MGETVNIFGRRKSDRFQGRILILLVCLTGLSCVLAALVGCKALIALTHFDEMMVEGAAAARAERLRRSPLGGPY